MARQALAAQQRVLGPEHPDWLRSLATSAFGSWGAAACARRAGAARVPKAQLLIYFDDLEQDPR